MATSGRKLDSRTQEQIQRLRSNGVSVRETAKRVMVSTRTVQVYTSKSAPS